MKNKLLICAVAALAAACQGDGVRRDQQQTYQTVQEGSATGVTSTINAPAAVTPPMTATNADTTSNLQLPVATTGTAFGQAGNLAGTMPGNQSGSMSVPYQGDASSQGYPVAGSPTARRPHVTTARPAATPSTTSPALPMTSAVPEAPRPSARPAREPEPTPAPTETTETTTPPAPSTDTTSTKEKPKQEPPSPPPSTDTSTTTSPPPTTT